MLSSKLKKQQGYLYIDAVVAVFIVGVSLVAIAGIFMQSSQASARAVRYTAATNIAQQQMELLKQRSTDFWRNPQLPNSLPWLGKERELIVNHTNFFVLTTIDQIDAIDTTLVKVTVRVSWQEKGSTKYIQLLTYFSKI